MYSFLLSHSYQTILKRLLLHRPHNQVYDMLTLWEDTPISVYKLVFSSIAFNWINTLEQTFWKWGFPHSLTKPEFLQMRPWRLHRNKSLGNPEYTEVMRPTISESSFVWDNRWCCATKALPSSESQRPPSQPCLELPYSSADFQIEPVVAGWSLQI